MIQYILYRETRFVETSFLMYKILTKPFLLVQTHTTCPYNLEVNRRHTPLTLGKDHFTADLHFGFSRLGNFIQNNKKNSYLIHSKKQVNCPLQGRGIKKENWPFNLL